MEIGGTVPGGIAAEEDFGDVKLEGVQECVEDFRGHQVTGHEYVAVAVEINTPASCY